jgi:hypothetical protein
MQRGKKNMAKIHKLVYVVILFLSLFLVAAEFDIGKPLFHSSQIFLFTL